MVRDPQGQYEDPWNRRLSRKKQPFETNSKSGYILKYYEKYYPDLLSEWADQANEICPVKTRDINAWVQNLATFGNIDPNKDIENREMLLNLSKSFLHDCIKY